MIFKISEEDHGRKMQWRNMMGDEHDVRRIDGDLRRLNLRPDDVLVLTVPGQISAESAAEIKERVSAALRIKNRVLVLGGGMMLSVIGAGPEAA